MKKRHRYDVVPMTIKFQSNHVITNNNIKGIFELWLPLILSFWCLVFLFYSKLGVTHGNQGYFDSSDINTSSSGVRECKLYASDGSKIAKGGLLVNFNASVTTNYTSVQDSRYLNTHYSSYKTSEFSKPVWSILGYPSSLCGVYPEDQTKHKDKENLPIERTPTTYLNLDEFRNISIQEKNGNTSSRLVNITHRLEPDGTEYNYASEAKGAKVLSHNKEAKGASNILGKDHDKYLRNPCSVGGKFVVIELAEETLVDAIKIANFEHYSSNFKEFELFGSLVYPTDTWSPLGKFVAANVKHAQCFKMTEPKSVRYLKLNLLSHYGSEFYCTISVVEVYGIDAIEQMLEDLIVAPGKSITKSTDPNTTVMTSITQEHGVSEPKLSSEIPNTTESTSKGTEGLDDGGKPIIDVVKNTRTIGNTPELVVEVRQQSNGRIHGDAVLKILMQKVKSLEINLSVLEDYIKELSKRQAYALPGIEKDMSRHSVLLEKSKEDIRDILEWKKTMERDFDDLHSWKAVISSQMDALVKENRMLRLDVEKVVNDQESLEKREMAVLGVSFFFLFLATLKLVSQQVLMFLGLSLCGKVCQQTSSGWIMMLVSSSMTIFITLLCS